jgi:hypothetical protein
MGDDSKWKIDDTVVLFFCVFGFGGGIVAGKLGLPPIVGALLLATGVAALIYRFLGGIADSTFTVGALKLTGTAAFLVGMTWYLNGQLESQLAKAQDAAEALVASKALAEAHPLTTAELAKSIYRWDYGSAGWTGDYSFKLDEDKKIVFSGQESYQCTTPGNCHTLYEITNGHAYLVGPDLYVKAHIHDLRNNREFDVETGTPLKRTVAFEGSMQDPNNPGQNFGVSLFARTY